MGWEGTGIKDRDTTEIKNLYQLPVCYSILALRLVRGESDFRFGFTSMIPGTYGSPPNKSLELLGFLPNLARCLDFPPSNYTHIVYAPSQESQTRNLGAYPGVSGQGYSPRGTLFPTMAKRRIPVGAMNDIHALFRVLARLLYAETDAEAGALATEARELAASAVQMTEEAAEYQRENRPKLGRPPRERIPQGYPPASSPGVPYPVGFASHPPIPPAPIPPPAPVQSPRASSPEGVSGEFPPGPPPPPAPGPSSPLPPPSGDSQRPGSTGLPDRAPCGCWVIRDGRPGKPDLAYHSAACALGPGPKPLESPQEGR